ncbi:MAG TPA: hypothetical protein DCS07_06055 [Bdellovibrionales bacterium]|nr:MAG: hypothetical protein A2Z97_05205 [Bdellovibrionales bacterium GWB1_52_6]OFZ04588.1 MAG: hypothetical protein A2X97_13280 [Bdellovibrionales bacterium GWA1_52_35]OFZ43339.1 MAG: hypothetical protein A2070_04720 [Bdellovibrionales bacterium GWC1_52_8]HAR42180.1 hypothetical protein [Bdellovibrionales bacterium]HCM39999.1 hypothetical protein [Bdellovibrionales bacterium]
MKTFKKLDPTAVCSLALKIEAASLSLYDFGSKNAKQPAVAKLCSELAEQERKHGDFFREFEKNVRTNSEDDIFNWLIRGATTDEFVMKISLDFETEVFKKLGLVLDPASLSNLTPIQLVRYAISIEEAAVAFYSGLKNHVKASHKKYMVELANEEKGHLLGLLKLLSELGPNE